MTKTVSLETAKLLKEAGWVQTLTPTKISHWYVWFEKRNDNGGEWQERTEPFNNTYKFRESRIAAPDTTELLEALPPDINDETLALFKSKTDYHVGYMGWDEEGGSMGILSERREQLPEALAALWLKLRKQKLI